LGEPLSRLLPESVSALLVDPGVSEDLELLDARRDVEQNRVATRGLRHAQFLEALAGSRLDVLRLAGGHVDPDLSGRPRLGAADGVHDPLRVELRKEVSGLHRLTS